MEKTQKNYPIWLLKPKYNSVFQINNEKEELDFINEEGGVFVEFDHNPTEDEKLKAFWDYNMPEYELGCFDKMKQEAIEEEMNVYFEQEEINHLENEKIENILQNKNKIKF
jgi:hypothetical protein